MNFKQKAKQVVALGLAASTMVWAAAFVAVPTASAAAHGQGCLVNVSGTVYLVTGNERRGFTSAEVFMSHGYNFGQVVAGNADDTDLNVGAIMIYANGTLVKGPNDPLVYLVVNGQKRPFTSGSVFTGLGYSFANIQWAPVNTFSDIPTGANIDSTTITGLPMSGPGPQTVNCSTGTPSGELEGGAGDLTLTETSTDVEDEVGEGKSDVKVLGFKAEADGSDIEITSLKVTLKNTGFGPSSENLERYLDEVSVFMEDDMVGSADADTFSKESSSPDMFSKTISLSDAIVREDDDAKFYVAVSALSNIDSEDLDDASFDIVIDTLRFTDATGAILTGDVSDFDESAETDNFTFEDASTDNQIDLKSTSANPDDQSVKVDEDDTSDEYLDLVFKLDVDEDSEDVEITSIPLVVHFANYDVNNDASVNGSDDSTSDSGADQVVDTIMVSVDGDEFEADLDSDSVSIVNGTGTATYNVDFDDGDFSIDAGDEQEVEVSLSFNSQEDNYNEDMTVFVTVANETISAETSDDEVDVEGSDQTGATLTLTLSGATVEVTETDHSQNDAGTLGTFSFEVTITAEDGDVDVDAASIVETLLGPDQTPGPTLSVVNLDGDATENGSNDFTVQDGESNTFSISYTLDPDTSGTYYIRLDSVDGVVVDETVGPESLSAS